MISFQKIWVHAVAAAFSVVACVSVSSTSTSLSKFPAKPKDGSILNAWYRSGRGEQSLVDLTGYSNERRPHWPNGINIAIYQTAPIEGTESISARISGLWREVAFRRPTLPVRISDLGFADALTPTGVADRVHVPVGTNVVVRISPYFLDTMHLSRERMGANEQNAPDLVELLAPAVIQDPAEGPYTEVSPVEEFLRYSSNLERIVDSRKKVVAQNPLVMLENAIWSFLEPSRDRFGYYFRYNPPRHASCSSFVFLIGNEAQFAVVDISLSNVTENASGKFRISSDYNDIFLEESLNKCIYNTATSLLGYVVDPDIRSVEGRQEALRALEKDNPYLEQ